MTKINSDTLLIINPWAGNGEAGRKRQEIEELAGKFFGEHQILLTDRPGRAADFASQALEAGVGKVICVGGDGTLNEVVNGLLSGLGENMARPELGYLPVGTGSDLARTAGITGNLENGIRNIATGRGRPVGVGRATFIDNGGVAASRYFINVLSFALGGEVAGRVNRSSKALGGFLSFLWATVTALRAFEKPRVRLKIGDRVVEQTVCWHVAIANGQYQGGGMCIAPGATLDDGSLRVTVVGDLSVLGVLLNLPSLYNGKIYSVKKVLRFSGQKIEAESGDRVLIDLDGEQVGRLPLGVELFSSALRMIY